MIGGVAKAYNLTFDYVLYEMSYVNVVMYSSVLPSYDDNKEEGNGEDVISSDDPRYSSELKKMMNK